MGFGPTLPDGDKALRAIREVVELLYPDLATLPALQVVEQIAAVLLEAKAPLSFEKMDQFLRDPAWREEMGRRAPGTFDPWAPFEGAAIDPRQLDSNFARLLADRLQANAHWLPPAPADEKEPSGED